MSVSETKMFTTVLQSFPLPMTPEAFSRADDICSKKYSGQN